MVKLKKNSVSEPVEGLSPGWGTRNLAMSQGGEFCSLAADVVFWIFFLSWRIWICGSCHPYIFLQELNMLKSINLISLAQRWSKSFLAVHLAVSDVSVVKSNNQQHSLESRSQYPRSRISFRSAMAHCMDVSHLFFYLKQNSQEKEPAS